MSILRRAWVEARWRWFRRRRVREFEVNIGLAADRLGAELFANIVRCNVSANRMLAAMELLLLNAQVKAHDEPSFTRNKGALTAWAASEMREAAKAFLHMKQLGAKSRLTVSNAQWQRLESSARRWTSKDSEYRIFREKLTAHRDHGAIVSAIEKLSTHTVTYARLAGPEARHQYYSGADEIAWQAWRLEAGVTDFRPFAETMERDVTAFARDLEVVMLDLFEMLHRR